MKQPSPYLSRADAFALREYLVDFPTDKTWAELMRLIRIEDDLHVSDRLVVIGAGFRHWDSETVVQRLTTLRDHIERQFFVAANDELNRNLSATVPISL